MNKGISVGSLDQRAHTTVERLQNKTSFEGSPETITQASPGCEACGGAEWEFDGLNRRPQKTVACFECVDCGAALQVRLGGIER